MAPGSSRLARGITRLAAPGAGHGILLACTASVWRVQTTPPRCSACSTGWMLSRRSCCWNLVSGSGRRAGCAPGSGTRYAESIVFKTMQRMKGPVGRPPYMRLERVEREGFRIELGA